MKPAKTPACNFIYYLGGSGEESALPCYRTLNPHATRSFWVPEDTDNLDGATTIHLQTFGFVDITNVILGYGDGMDQAEVNIYEGVPYDVGVQWTLELTEAHKNYLKTPTGGYFIVEVPMAPPMPISVWVAP